MVDLPTTLDLEQASLLAWPAHEEIIDGFWIGRLAGGFSRRSNSLQSLDPADDSDIEARLDAMRPNFTSRGLPFIFRVTPLAGPNLQAALPAQGWTESDHNWVMAMPLRKVMRPVAAHTGLFEPTDPQWIETQTGFAGTQAKGAALTGILSRLSTPAKAIIAYRDDLKPAAAALVVVANGIAVMLNVVVDEDVRGMGYGRAVMHAALNWAVHAKAQFAALQVQADNEPALGLYRALGFVPQYQYVYWVAPQ